MQIPNTTQMSSVLAEIAIHSMVYPYVTGVTGTGVLAVTAAARAEAEDWS